MTPIYIPERFESITIFYRIQILYVLLKLKLVQNFKYIIIMYGILDLRWEFYKWFQDLTFKQRRYIDKVYKDLCLRWGDDLRAISSHRHGDHLYIDATVITHIDAYNDIYNTRIHYETVDINLKDYYYEIKLLKLMRIFLK